MDINCIASLKFSKMLHVYGYAVEQMLLYFVIPVCQFLDSCKTLKVNVNSDSHVRTGSGILDRIRTNDLTMNDAFRHRLSISQVCLTSLAVVTMDAKINGQIAS